MKVEVFTDSYLPGIGGTEKAVIGICKGLIKNGHQVAVACPKYKTLPPDLGYPVFRSKSLHLFGQNYAAFSSFSSKFKKQIKDFNPDIIHCNTVNDMLTRSLKLSKKLHIPVLATVHTRYKECYLHDSKSKLITHFLIKSMVRKLNKVDLITTVSNSMKNELIKYGVKNEIVVIKNGCDYLKNENIEESIKLSKEIFNFKDKPFIFLFVGRIEKIKNIDFSLDMLAELKKEYSNFKFIIVGEGTDKKYFEQKVATLNLQDNVIFYGVVKDKKILNSIYAMSDLLLFPSIIDNDSLVILEAASNKTSTIAIKGTGSSERITPDFNGFICENNLQSYLRNVKQIINNKELLNNVSTNAYNTLLKTWDKVVLEYIEVYKRLLNNNTKDNNIQKKL